MYRWKKGLAAAAACSSFLIVGFCTGKASAVTFTETTDVGQLLGTAQTLNPGTDTVNGFLGR